MRIPIPASTAARLNPTRLFHSKKVCHVRLQIFDAGVTVFVSRREADLQTADALGNPLRGFQYGQGIFDLFYQSGEVWATCNQQIEVEVDAWALSGEQVI